MHILRLDVFHMLERMALCNKRSKPLVIGINGVDTSGKSEFATALSRYLIDRGHLVQIVRIDDFHNPRQVRASGSDEIQSYIDHAFDLRRLEGELLAPIQRGEALDKDLMLLDLDTDTYQNQQHYTIDQNTIVILEGTLLFREPINRYLDFRIYLDISFDEVLRRAELRDVPRYGIQFLDRYRMKYIPIQKWYIDNLRPHEISDIIIDNNDYLHPKVIASAERTSSQNAEGPRG